MLPESAEHPGCIHPVILLSVSQLPAGFQELPAHQGNIQNRKQQDHLFHPPQHNAFAAVYKQDHPNKFQNTNSQIYGERGHDQGKLSHQPCQLPAQKAQYPADLPQCHVDQAISPASATLHPQCKIHTVESQPDYQNRSSQCQQNQLNPIIDIRYLLYHVKNKDFGPAHKKHS